MKGFLYGQTEYNIKKNTIRLDDYIKMAKENGFDYLTITDSNLYGSYKFYKKCIKESIKPIIGLEYKYKCDDESYSYLLLYALNNKGYKNLLKISSLVELDKKDTLEDIMGYTANIACIFVYNDSYIERLINSKEYEMLDSFLNKLNVFNNYYIGISYTNRLDKLNSNSIMENYAKSNNLNIIPVHQAKYLTSSDSDIYEIVRMIDGKKEELDERYDYSFNIDPVCDNSIDDLINSINLDLFNEKVKLPKYPNTKGATSKDFLFALCHKGLEKRGKYKKEYIDRLNYELSVIEKMGYNDYFLIVWDYIKYSKQNGILVGPGRGSAAGSLVAYTLGITDLDPLEYDLLFERFLNPERVSMPDIDTDFPDDRRDDVIRHVKEVYGDNHVCSITAFSEFKVKGTIRDVAKIKKISDDRVSRLVDFVDKYGMDAAILEYKDYEDIIEVLSISKRLFGIPRQTSTHAAGIILSAVPLDDLVPVKEGLGIINQAQYEASDLEEIGLLKMDFLGIRNLQIIDNIIKEIPGFSQAKLRNLPFNDKKTYELLSKADTLGVFQLESEGMRNVFKKLKPTCFTDLVAVIALYRPGPMEYIPEFIERKHGKKFEYIHPDIKPVLEETYGIMVYQEQIMKTAQIFAGFSLGDADLLRRAISKKNADKLKMLEEDFIKGCINKGYSEKLAKDLYAMIYKFADYGFNKSHSVVYAAVAYQMAYFKANYPEIFIAKTLNNVIGDTNARTSYIKYAKTRGIKVYNPDINISSLDFSVYNNSLYMPFTSILSIGDLVARKIVEERNTNGKYESISDFRRRCSFLTSAAIDALIYAGALDCFGKTKKSIIGKKESDDIFESLMQGETKEITDEFDFKFLAEQEYKYLSINLKYSLFSDSNALYKRCKAIPLKLLKYNQESRLVVEIANHKVIKTKKNEYMAVGTFEDDDSSYRFVIFPKVFKDLDKLEEGCLYLVLATLEKDNKNEDSINVSKIAKL